MNNKDMRVAKEAKKDEFYTRLETIEKELNHYEGKFEGLTVYCNCDDPTRSNFWRYFHENFTRLGLKKLISTHYEAGSRSYKMEYGGGGDDADVSDGVRTPLEGDGDFRSPECVELLKEADVVSTNPPFSLFRDLFALLVENEKKFLIVGNMLASQYAGVFPMIKANKVWYGPSLHSGSARFDVPDSYPLEARTCGIDEDGRRFIDVKGVRWFSNIEHDEPTKPLELTERYSPERYGQYDERDAINVDKTSEIPCDYFGKMGVPVSFLDKYDPKQFEILELRKKPMMNGKAKFSRFIIKRRQ